MSQDYRVTEIVERREWSGKHGPMVSFDMRVDGHDGIVELAQKPETGAPQVGDVIHGHLEEGRFGKQRLKKDQRGGFGGGSGTGGGPGKDFKADPAKLRAEAMRSAIHAATGYVTAMAGVGRVPENFTYRDMDAMIHHFYALIESVMQDPMPVDQAAQRTEAAL